MSLVKVSVENADNNEKTLHEIDMNNFKTIKDGYFLQLVYSLTYYAKRIFDHIDDEYKVKSFEDLYDLSVDPEFIKEIVRTEKHLILIDHFTKKELAENEATACLIAIVHLFQKGYISEISPEFLEKIISICKNATHDELVKYALSVTHKTIKKVSITDLVPFIRKKTSQDLQYGALLVINAIVRCCKGEKRQQLIKEINLKQNRETISQYIIAANNVDKPMARELYIYQTFLLRHH
ncbi:hypothetical protein BDFB_012498 [Asbolus verrucosus]|uniref:ELMO armadillo-like helical domain-containing protein n=1 Tax=Asbolus verrucosus TaxID=1661398 RepID=A0A482VZ04_ASBVE|nr:hypothetical protein BDFB_012498 [Asbolus verrucosus]